MNQQFYPYYNNNNNAENNAFGYNPPRRKTSTGRHPSSQTDSTHRFRSTSAQQILHNKKLYVHQHTNKAPASLPSTKLLRPHSKSNVETFNSDNKPRLTDISSQESDQQQSSMSTEFKKWSQQRKIHALRKAKSQHSAAAGAVDENYAAIPQYMRHASSSYPYGGASQQRQFYGNINNYIDTQYRTKSNQHTRDRSHQSQQSLHSLQSLQSQSNNSQLSNNGVSSSSDDFIKENMKHYGSYYTDYASPSPTQLAKMWPTGGSSPAYTHCNPLNNQLSNNSQASTSTKHSIGSLKTMKSLNNRNSSYSSIFSEISKHLEQCIQYLQQQIPRDYIQFMNEAMVKITLEFCGFDIENMKKFNSLFVQLQQHLIIQHVHTTQNASTMSYFVYSGDKLIEYFKKCVDLLSSYIQSPRAIGHNNETLLNVLYSYYVKRHASMQAGAYSMSVYALTSFYEICYEYRLAQEQMKKMNDKLAVVKNLFHDEIKTPSPRAILTTESDTASTNKVLMGNNKHNAPQHNLTQQLSAPVKHHQLQPNPINHSKSHPEMSVKHAKHNKENKANDDVSDAEYKGDDGGETTPVLSDINDIDHHLSSSQNNNALNMEYDSDLQSEMSATPQPSDIQRAIIQQFIPGAMNQNMANIDVMHEMKDEGSNMAPKMMRSEISNDADDEVSSPGSIISTSTDNDTIGTDSRFKTIKTLTPTPHTHKTQQRSSQIIIPSPVEELRTSKSKKYSTTPMPKKSSTKIGFGKRQSWTEVTTAKIDVYVSNDKTEFKSFSPINPKQGVENIIKEFRKSLGQNELKGDVEKLREEMLSASASCSDDENTDIVDVNEQSDCSDCENAEGADIVHEDDDEFFDDDELEAKQAKYISLTSNISNLPSNNNNNNKKLVLNSMNSNDTTSSRYKPKTNYNMIPQQNTAQAPQRTSSHSRTSRSNKNKRPSREDRYTHEQNNEASTKNQSANILYDNGILNNNKQHRNRRGSDSETGALRNLNYGQYSNNTVQSKRRQHHTNNTQQPLDLKYYNSNSSRHSRSSSDFISNNANLYKSRPLLKKKSSNQLQYNNYQQLSLYEEEHSPRSTSPLSTNSARIYQRKAEEASSPKQQNKSSRIQKRVPAKYDQIRKNYIIRAKYVDQHKSFSKYSSDRNKSWKKWIKLLQAHHSDITNVGSPAQVQTLIDFARMSLGNYGNWLMMKSGSNSGSQSSLSSSKSNPNKWTTYFAVMRDFNLFLFRQECVPSNLEDVINEDYLALSVAHIENVKTCSKNPAELYLEVTGSKSNHKLKFRCESTDACQQWVAEMNYQIHIVSDLCCNQSLRLECADQKRSIWIPVAPLTQINPYSN